MPKGLGEARREPSFLFIGIQHSPNETCLMEKPLELIFQQISNEKGLNSSFCYYFAGASRWEECWFSFIQHECKLVPEREANYGRKLDTP